MSDTWLVTGASGLLGRAACAALARPGRRIVGVRHEHPVGIAGVDEIVADLMDLGVAADIVANVRPTTVLHAAGLTDVDRCESEPDRAAHIHVDVSRALAASCPGVRFVHISTDHLWDGSQAYVREDTPTCPLNVYARTKRDGELAVLEAHDRPLVVRTNFFGQGSSWRMSLSDWLLAELRAGRSVRAFGDVYFTPIHFRHLISAIERLLAVDASGVLHVAGSERISKYDFALRVAGRAGLDPVLVQHASVREAHLAAARPSDMSLDTSLVADLLGAPLPDLDASVSVLADDNCGQHG